MNGPYGASRSYCSRQIYVRHRADCPRGRDEFSKTASARSTLAGRVTKAIMAIVEDPYMIESHRKDGERLRFDSQGVSLLSQLKRSS